MTREVGLGVVAAAVLLVITFFGGAGTIELFTLALVVVGLVWFATCRPSLLLGPNGRPSVVVFGFGLLELTLLLTAASVMIGRSGTVLTSALVGIAAIIVGLVRAVRAGLPPEKPAPPP